MCKMLWVYDGLWLGYLDGNFDLESVFRFKLYGRIKMAPTQETMANNAFFN